MNVNELPATFSPPTGSLVGFAMMGVCIIAGAIAGAVFGHPLTLLLLILVPLLALVPKYKIAVSREEIKIRYLWDGRPTGSWKLTRLN